MNVLHGVGEMHSPSTLQLDPHWVASRHLLVPQVCVTSVLQMPAPLQLAGKVRVLGTPTALSRHIWVLHPFVES